MAYLSESNQILIKKNTAFETKPRNGTFLSEPIVMVIRNTRGKLSRLDKNRLLKYILKLTGLN